MAFTCALYVDVGTQRRYLSRSHDYLLPLYMVLEILDPVDVELGAEDFVPVVDFLGAG